MVNFMSATHTGTGDGANKNTAQTCSVQSSGLDLRGIAVCDIEVKLRLGATAP